MSRRWVYKVGAPIILLPVLPFYVLRQALEACVRGIDWMIEGRAFPKWLSRQVDRLDIWSLQ